MRAPEGIGGRGAPDGSRELARANTKLLPEESDNEFKKAGSTEPGRLAPVAN
jgi:hypothetical protein